MSPLVEPQSESPGQVKIAPDLACTPSSMAIARPSVLGVWTGSIQGANDVRYPSDFSNMAHR